jgi:hypothetical protein
MSGFEVGFEAASWIIATSVMASTAVSRWANDLL